jgi:hypothetical protein
MIHAFPTWEYATDSHLLKLQRLQNKVLLRSIGNLAMRTPVRELHVAFKILYVYGYKTKLCGDTGRSNPKPCKSKCMCYWTIRSHA